MKGGAGSECFGKCGSFEKPENTISCSSGLGLGWRKRGGGGGSLLSDSMLPHKWASTEVKLRGSKNNPFCSKKSLSSLGLLNGLKKSGQISIFIKDLSRYSVFFGTVGKL